MYVKPKEFTKGCSCYVDIVCDYCGKIFHRKYVHHINSKKKTIIDKDCCADCQPKKAKEVFKIKYGVEHPMQLDSYKENYINIIKKMYGVSNISQLDEIKEKKKQTCLEHFGVDNYTKTQEYQDRIAKITFDNGGIHPCQTKEACEKRIQTCIEKYGVSYPGQNEDVKQKAIVTNLERYGCKNVFQNEDVKSKIRETLYSHGDIATSKQQIEIFNMLEKMGYEVKLNYPVDKFSLDVALFYCGKKFDIEYDGWYWHKDKQKDDARNSVLLNLGWNIIRIQSGNLLPTAEDLDSYIKNAIKNKEQIQFIKLSDWIKNNEDY